jgi:hypothetical protein
MTVEEKNKAIRDYCEKHSCDDCPLKSVSPCYGYELSVEMIDKRYEMVFGSTPVNTCVVCGAEIPEGRQVCPDCEIGDGCDNCAFALKEPDEEPCNKCKNNILMDDPRYETAPLNWKPEGYIAPDPIKPEYYNDTKITPFDVIDDWGLNFYLGNAVKYIKRAGKKADNSRLQDLKKIREYIDHEIRAEEE